MELRTGDMISSYAATVEITPRTFGKGTAGAVALRATVTKKLILMHATLGAPNSCSALLVCRATTIIEAPLDVMVASRFRFCLMQTQNNWYHGKQ